MKKKPKTLMLEGKGSLRGLVPTSSFGVKDIAYNEYLKPFDPRQDGPKGSAVRIALAQASDIRFREFLERTMDPRCKHMSLATLAKERDIPLHQMAEFWQKAQHQRALAIAQNGIVEVMDDIVDDAKSKDEPCVRCDGYGFVYVEEDMPKKAKGVDIRHIDPDDPGSRLIRTCPTCEGHGKTRKSGDTDSRKMLLETTGHTGKRSAGVQIVQNFGGADMSSAVDKLSKISFDLDPADYEEVPVQE